MLAQLTGRIVSSGLTEVVLDVNGIGFILSIPMSTYDKLPRVEEKVTLLTYMCVREDSIQLFGFASSEELEIFKMLITVKGIGAKTAILILGSMNIACLVKAIYEADVKTLKKLNGVGQRSAERVILELRDKLEKRYPEYTSLSGNSEKAGDVIAPAIEDAILALEQLGFQNAKLREDVYKLVESIPENQRSSENIVREALRKLNRL